MVNTLIAVMLAVVVGLALLPVVNTTITNLTADAVMEDGVVVTEAGQFNGTVIATLIELLPVLFVLILVAGVVLYIKFRKN